MTCMRIFSKKECLRSRGEAGPLCLCAQVPVGKGLQLLWDGRTVRELPAELIFLWTPSDISFPCVAGFAMKASDHVSHFWHQIRLYQCPLEIMFYASASSMGSTFCQKTMHIPANKGQTSPFTSFETWRDIPPVTFVFMGNMAKRKASVSSVFSGICIRIVFSQHWGSFAGGRVNSCPQSTGRLEMMEQLHCLPAQNWFVYSWK